MRVASVRTDLVDQLVARVTSGPGALDPGIRASAYRSAGLDSPLAGFADKVAERASTITDRDFSPLREAGLSEDQILELAVAVALGTGMRRLEAGLQALESA